MMADVYCSNCKFWSELSTQTMRHAVDQDPVTHAACLNVDSVYHKNYTHSNAVCSKHELGRPIDDPFGRR